MVVAALRSLGPATQQYQTATALYTILHKIGKKGETHGAAGPTWVARGMSFVWFEVG